MSLQQKYQEYKDRVNTAEKKRRILRTSDSWLEIRRLKKEKLALKDALASQKR